MVGLMEKPGFLILLSLIGYSLNIIEKMSISNENQLLKY